MAGMSESSVVVRPPEVPNAIEEQAKALAALEDRMNLLVTRLDSVLRPVPPVNGVEQGVEPRYGCSVAISLDQNIYKINVIRGRVDMILDRLQV
jgi:hypothetical protein